MGFTPQWESSKFHGWEFQIFSCDKPVQHLTIHNYFLASCLSLMLLHVSYITHVSTLNSPLQLTFTATTANFSIYLHSFATCSNLKYRTIALLLQFLSPIAPLCLHAPPIDSTILAGSAQRAECLAVLI